MSKPDYRSPCGRVELYCGDCRDIVPRLPLKSAALFHADPPYGMGKEKDGVKNDNFYGGKLDAFLFECWQACRPALADNASAYVWGEAESLWRFWFRHLEPSERFTMRNEIIWHKGINGAPWEDGRSYQPATERALFFMLGEQGFNNNSDNYWEGWEPIRSYLAGERAKMGWSVPDMKRAAGHSALSRDHWTGKSQWSFPPRPVYEKLQGAAKRRAFKRTYDDLKRTYDDLKRTYDDLKRTYDDLKREFYSTRAYFDNVHQNMSDVWSFPRVIGKDRHGHATPKPVSMMARIVKTSCPPGGLVLDPFMGTAPAAIACLKSGRRFVGVELCPIHFETARKRIEVELMHRDLFLDQPVEKFHQMDLFQ